MIHWVCHGNSGPQENWSARSDLPAEFWSMNAKIGPCTSFTLYSVYYKDRRWKRKMQRKRIVIRGRARANNSVSSSGKILCGSQSIIWIY